MMLRVVSYNIQMGGEDRLPAIAAVIRALRPDAVALLEATSHANVAALANDTGMREAATGPANNGVHHIVWLTRAPIVRGQNHDLSFDGAPLRLFATHLASRHDARSPVDEAAAIVDLLRPLAGQPHLLLGDFNALRPGDPVGAPPPGVEKRGDAVDGAPRRAIGLLLDAGYVDCYRALHADLHGHTYPSTHPWLRLDHIFASPSMAARVRACEVVDDAAARAASDHLPVWAEFQ
jgi:endonuclease/exonuclease/phosphatase family metal-dependent hydrolase